MNLFIYRKNFQQVKYFHEVPCTAPVLNYFRNLFKISKLECVNSAFFPNTTYKLFRGNCPGQKSVVICSGRNFVEGGCPGLVVQGELFREKCPGGKSREVNFMGANCPGGKSLGVIVLGGTS